MTPCTCMWTGCGGTVQQNTPRQNWCSHQTHTLNPSSSLYNLKIANLYHFYVCGVNTSKRPCACGYVCWVWGWGGVVGMLTVIATANHTVRSLALPHIGHAMLLHLLLHFHTYVMQLHVLLHFHTYVLLRCCTFSCTSTRASCYAAACSLALPHIRHATLLHVLLHIHTYVMLHCCTFSCTSTHTSCYAAARSLALPRIRHATLLHVLLHFHTYVMLRCCTFSCTSTHRSSCCTFSCTSTHTSCSCTFSCTSTHMSCYGAARSLALPHVRHATLLHVLLHFHTYVMLRCCTLSCTSTHTSCYTAARSLALPHIGHATLLHVILHFHSYVMLRCCTFLLHFHTYVMLHCCMFSCTSTHMSCYTAACSLALPHICHATLLHVLCLLHFHAYVMLRARTACYADGCKAWKGASKTTSARKTPQMVKLCPQSQWVCEALGRKPTKKNLLCPERRL